MITFGKFIDLIGQNLDRIKTIGVLVLIILFTMSIINNGCSRSELETMVEKVTGLNVQNDILRSDINKRDSILTAKTDSINQLKAQIKKSQENETKLIVKYGHIKRKYDDLASDLLKIPSEDSYAFLDTVAYPYGGIKKYPFSAPQVKGFHRTYLEHEQLISLNENLQEQKAELYKQIKLQSKLEMESTASIASMEANRRDLEQIIDNKDETIAIKDKQLKKAKRNGLFQKIGIGAIALLIGFAAGG